jgi:hypothetical protein
MSSSNTVWISISCDLLAQEIKRLLDMGFFAEASAKSYKANALLNKMKTFVQSKGGNMKIMLLERQVFELGVIAAEELPNLVQSYKTEFGRKISVGMGLTFEEASKAMQLSTSTGDIEMYDPETHSKEMKEEFGANAVKDTEKYFKAEGDSPDFDLDMDLDMPEYNQAGAATSRNGNDYFHAPVPDINAHQQMEQQYIQQINQSLGFDPQQMMQQQQQPRDLLESLNGGQMQGYNPEQAQQEKAQSKEGANPSDEEQQMESEVAQAEEEAKQTDQKLATLLGTVKEQIPQIMALSQKDPKAFKQAMAMVSKLVNVAHQRKKTQKAETLESAEEFAKAIKMGIHRHQLFPVGTRLKGKKKVMVNGKEVWRSLRAGQVRDSKMQPISVESSNYYAEKGLDGKDDPQK